MAEISYLDFDLHIEREDDAYTVLVSNSPAGQATADFKLPFSDLELENFLLRVGRTRRGVRRLDSPEMEAAKQFGGRLFEAVFDDEVRGCLRSSLDEANRQGAGLRIRLHLSDAPELADLPWEYLYNPSLNRFLVLSTTTPLVRYVDLPERIRPLAIEPPLRVIVMISSPSDYPALDVEKEWANLREALGDLERRGLVALERLEDATLANLQRRLRREEYHIFHFVGHGAFDEQAQDGVLLLEDEAGRGRAVSGQYLGALMHDEQTLRLAILNSCEGARTSRSDPFAGAAQSLVQQGIPAVIAMQFEITDEAAIALAHEFYAALADGYPVDAALAEARKAIFAEGNDVEWGVPVLYMRALDGRIFEVERVGEEELEQVRRRQEPATLFARGQAHYQDGRLHEALEYFRQVQAQGDNYKDVDTVIAQIEQEMMRKRSKSSTRVYLLSALLVIVVLMVATGLLVAGTGRLRGLQRNNLDDSQAIAEAIGFAKIPDLEGDILFTARINEQLAVVSSVADGSQPPNVVEPNGGTAMWSPSRVFIVFQRADGGATNIFRADEDGSNQTQLTDVATGRYARTPAWFPTEELILYESDVDGGTEIYSSPIVLVDGERMRNKITTTTGGDSSSPSVSPDGRDLAFSSNIDGDWDIYAMELGSEDNWIQLTDAPGSDEFPMWSPDGKQIAFSSERDGNYEIYVMNADGSQQQRLTTTPGDKWSRVPAWSPDGEHIAFVSNQENSFAAFYGDIYVVDVNSKVVRQLTSSGRIWTWRVSWATD